MLAGPPWPRQQCFPSSGRRPCGRRSARACPSPCPHWGVLRRLVEPPCRRATAGRQGENERRSAFIYFQGQGRSRNQDHPAAGIATGLKRPAYARSNSERARTPGALRPALANSGSRLRLCALSLARLKVARPQTRGPTRAGRPPAAPASFPSRRDLLGLIPSSCRVTCSKAPNFAVEHLSTTRRSEKRNVI